MKCEKIDDDHDHNDKQDDAAWRGTTKPAAAVRCAPSRRDSATPAAETPCRPMSHGQTATRAKRKRGERGVCNGKTNVRSDQMFLLRSRTGLRHALRRLTNQQTQHQGPIDIDCGYRSSNKQNKQRSLGPSLRSSSSLCRETAPEFRFSFRSLINAPQSRGKTNEQTNESSAKFRFIDSNERTNESDSLPIGPGGRTSSSASRTCLAPKIISNT